MIETLETTGTKAVEIKDLDLNLNITKYQNSGLNVDGEMFSCRLILEGEEVAYVTQEGVGRPNGYQFKDENTGTLLYEWAKKITGCEFDALDLIVDYLIVLRKGQKTANRFSRKHNARGAVLLLSKPSIVEEGEEMNPFSSFFNEIKFVTYYNDEKEAELLAREAGANFFKLIPAKLN